MEEVKRLVAELQYLERYKRLYDAARHKMVEFYYTLDRLLNCDPLEEDSDGKQ